MPFSACASGKNKSCHVAAMLERADAMHEAVDFHDVLRLGRMGEFGIGDQPLDEGDRQLAVLDPHEDFRGLARIFRDEIVRLQHRGDPFDEARRRLMHRTQIKGKVAPRAFVEAA